MKRALLLLIPALCCAQFHRAEQDREIRYWLLDPATHQFQISHDFNVDRPGQASVHSFVRAGSAVQPDSKITLLDTGEQLPTHIVTGKPRRCLSLLARSFARSSGRGGPIHSLGSPAKRYF